MIRPPKGRGGTVRLRAGGGRSVQSRRWLERHLNDPYVAEAKARGFRSRAAFKLLELDAKCGLLKPGMRVVDLGAAPGGWTQVAVQAVGPKGQVVALDILPMDPVPGATVLRADFTEPGAEAALRAALDGPADAVLSDMAPNTTGHAATDHLRITALAEMALASACGILAPGGAFVCKLFQGGADKPLLDRLRRDFAKLRHVKPPASRKESSEIYVVAQGFRGAGA
ncbi:MAG: RlmE family RNA methyltransferase [Acetobacteraceae bacterium]|nr:RlmE family RNA methyltransferase [Acetobacteraceae bacterium]MDW8398165.1 RlmE family RNA methyltransferase [Acetobacteraceae bacterium]